MQQMKAKIQAKCCQSEKRERQRERRSDEGISQQLRMLPTTTRTRLLSGLKELEPGAQEC